MPSKAGRSRVFVLALDGVSFTLLQTAFERGHCPELQALFQGHGTFCPVHSVIPPLSTVAWSSVITGKNPGKHGIFGFIDRRPNPLQTYIPTGRTLKSPTIFEYLSDHGKRVITMNVPGTTPPRPIQGVWIAGFMSLNLEKAVYPHSLASRLRELGYRIDVNPWRAKENPSQFLQDLYTALDRRIETALWLMQEVPNWDLFFFHIMETDRFLHFFWDAQNDPERAELFWGFFHHLDQKVAEVLHALPEGTQILSLSDHGFGPVYQEVALNTWLRDQGWLQFVQEPPKGLEDLDSRTKVYSLIPGRFYINLLGREAVGSVLPEEYEAWRDRLIEHLASLEDPKTGSPVVQKVFRREDLYWGPHLEKAADVIAVPRPGYEFKGSLKTSRLFQSPTTSGVHTPEDAYLFIQDLDLHPDKDPTLYDITATLLDLLGVPLPPDLDGQSLWRA